jgi:hypothetical protein
MVRHTPWQFSIFKFTADDGKHTVSIGFADWEDAARLIMDMYSNVRDFRQMHKPLLKGRDL